MAQRNGKCTNFGNCPLADNNRVVNVADGTEFICPACSHALTPVGASAPNKSNPLPLIVACVVLLGVVAAFVITRNGAGRSGAAVPNSGGVTPVLRLHGSNTIGAELAPALAIAFLNSLGASDTKSAPTGSDEVNVRGTLDGHPVAIEVAAHGSSTAFQDLASGNADIGMASRRVKPDEVTSLSSLGEMTSPASEHVLGLDGIAVVVNQGNPVQSLTKEQLAGIFSGEITDWSQAGWTPGAIRVYARDDKSGTYDSFKSLVLGSRALTPGARRLEDSRNLADAVAADASGIGFVGLPYVRGVRAIAVSETGARALVPNRLTVSTEDYPLSRRLYLYTAANPTDSYVRKFVDFALSAKGQDVVEQNGFIAQNVRAEHSETAVPSGPSEYQRLTSGAERLSLDFRFRTGSSELDNKALVDIGRVVSYVAGQKADPKNVLLLGFSDNSGGLQGNVKLSNTRAQSVASRLETEGIAPGVVKGFGPETPVASNDTEQGREKNRRVEIWIRK